MQFIDTSFKKCSKVYLSLISVDSRKAPMSIFSYPPAHARFSNHHLEQELSAASTAAELFVEFLLREVFGHIVYGQAREGLYIF